MPYKNPKHKTHNQRQHRRAGRVKRIEVTLSAESERDHEIAEFLDSLPLGSAAEFIRQAIHAAITHEIEPAQPEPGARSTGPVEQLEMMIADLVDESRRANQQLEAMIRDAMQRQPVTVAAAPPESPPGPPAAPGSVVSSGIDMSRPRPRKHPPGAKPAAAPPPSDLPDELSEADQIRLAKIMAASIKRAQPGRMSG